MALHQHHHSSGQEPRSSRSKWILAGSLAIAGFFLFTEHQAHVYGALPYLLLACPLMHFFHGHGHHESPILVLVYARLAKREEADMLANFGQDYERYRQRTPAFIPSLWERGVGLHEKTPGEHHG